MKLEGLFKLGLDEEYIIYSCLALCKKANTKIREGHLFPYVTQIEELNNFLNNLKKEVEEIRKNSPYEIAGFSDFMLKKKYPYHIEYIYDTISRILEAVQPPINEIITEGQNIFRQVYQDISINYAGIQMVADNKIVFIPHYPSKMTYVFSVVDMGIYRISYVTPPEKRHVKVKYIYRINKVVGDSGEATFLKATLPVEFRFFDTLLINYPEKWKFSFGGTILPVTLFKLSRFIAVF